MFHQLRIKTHIHIKISRENVPFHGLNDHALTGGLVGRSNNVISWLAIVSMKVVVSRQRSWQEKTSKRRSICREEAW